MQVLTLHSTHPLKKHSFNAKTRSILAELEQKVAKQRKVALCEKLYSSECSNLHRKWQAAIIMQFNFMTILQC